MDAVAEVMVEAQGELIRLAVTEIARLQAITIVARNEPAVTSKGRYDAQCRLIIASTKRRICERVKEGDAAVRQFVRLQMVIG